MISAMVMDGQLGEGDDGVLLLLVQSGGAVLPASTYSNVFSILQALTGDDDDLGPGPGQLGGGGGCGGDGVLSCSRGISNLYFLYFRHI